MNSEADCTFGHAAELPIPSSRQPCNLPDGNTYGSGGSASSSAQRPLPSHGGAAYQTAATVSSHRQRPSLRRRWELHYMSAAVFGMADVELGWPYRSVASAWTLGECPDCCVEC